MSDGEKDHDALVRRLRAADFDITSINEWIGGKTPGAAVGLLVQELDSASSETVIECIGRALTEPSFKVAGPALLRAFRRVRNDATRWALGNALATVGFQKSLWGEFLQVAADPIHGRGRQNIVWRLHRIKLPETVPLLEMLLEEPDVDAFAAMALGYCGDESSAKLLESKQLEGRSVLFRREVPKAARRIRAKRKAAG